MILDSIKMIPHNTHYVNRYLKFITSCANQNISGYVENHHILPKSIWPEYKLKSKSPWNLVKLTARQHYIAHYILSKCFYDKNKFKMVCSFEMMICKNQHHSERKSKSILYELSRKSRSKSRSESMSGSNNPFFGKTHSEETKKRILESKKGMLVSDETRIKMSKSRTGKTHSEASKLIMAEKAKGNSHTKGKKKSIETRLKMSSSQRRENNPAAKCYILTSPDGNDFIVKGSLQHFCRDNNLSYQKIKSSVDKGIIELTSTTYNYSEQTKNCVGWCISQNIT